MSAPAKNLNAAKGPELRSSLLHIRVTESDKTAWVEASKAEGVSLSDWVIKRLRRS
jgi:predicted HicB family RNase H-like nuclease